jgi:hypothetical protein
VNSEKWEQIKELLGSALEQEPGQRNAFLRAACGADDTLRAELEGLLAAYDSEKSAPAEPLPGRSRNALTSPERRSGPTE